MSKSTFLSDSPRRPLENSGISLVIHPKDIQAHLDSGEEYNPRFDLNNDGVIDDKDIKLAKIKLQENDRERGENSDIDILSFFANISTNTSKTLKSDKTGQKEPTSQTTTKSTEKAPNQSNGSDFDFWAWLKSLFGV